MYVIPAFNVRDALPKAVEYLTRNGIHEKSRLGDVLSSPEPVAILYYDPKKHVLLNPVRDANPFFHLIEAMWMLAGRDDGAFLDHYITDFSQRFGKDGIIEDAYGYRWRFSLGFDQLQEIVNQLQTTPNSRQCVLQMWGAKPSQPDILSDGAKPCNLAATFRIVNNKLDMTVFNRSNDLIWGCCGANAVHFPILQEYIAGRLEIEVGKYWQISTNLHLYMDHVKMMEKRIENMFVDRRGRLSDFLGGGLYAENTMPLMTFPAVFDEELYETLSSIEDIHANKPLMSNNDTGNLFLDHVVLPMAMTHQCYKNKHRGWAYRHLELVRAEDWRTAAKQWLDRRYTNDKY